MIPPFLCNNDRNMSLKLLQNSFLIVTYKWRTEFHTYILQHNRESEKEITPDNQFHLNTNQIKKRVRKIIKITKIINLSNYWLEDREWQTSDQMDVHQIYFILKWRCFDDIMSSSSNKKTFISVVTL